MSQNINTLYFKQLRLH